MRTSSLKSAACSSEEEEVVYTERIQKSSQCNCDRRGRAMQHCSDDKVVVKKKIKNYMQNSH